MFDCNTEVITPEDWFKSVYEIILACAIPYDALRRAEVYINETITFRDGKSPFNGWSDDEKEQFVNYSKKLMSCAPSDEEYIRIRKNIAQQAVDEIKEIYPAMKTAIVFGDPLGDIDIGIVLNNKDSRTIDFDDTYLEQLRNIRIKYPIVDVSAIDNYRCSSGEKLAELIFENHTECYSIDDIYPYLDEPLNHLHETFEYSWILYGDIQEYESFMGVYNTCIQPMKNMSFEEIMDVSPTIHDIVLKTVNAHRKK